MRLAVHTTLLSNLEKKGPLQVGRTLLGEWSSAAFPRPAHYPSPHSWHFCPGKNLYRFPQRWSSWLQVTCESQEGLCPFNLLTWYFHLHPRTLLLVFFMYQAFSLIYVICVVTHKFTKHCRFLFYSQLQAVNSSKAGRDGLSVQNA